MARRANRNAAFLLNEKGPEDHSAASQGYRYRDILYFFIYIFHFHSSLKFGFYSFIFMSILNYCISVVWHGGDQCVCRTAEV